MTDSSDESSMGEAVVGKGGRAQRHDAPEREVAEAPEEELLDGPLPSSYSKVPHPEPEAIPLPAVYVAPPSHEQLSKTVAKFGRPSTPTPKKDLGFGKWVAHFIWQSGNIHKNLFCH